MTLGEPPINRIIAVLLLLGAVLAAARGTRRLVRGVGQAAPLDVVRGIRGWVIAVASAVAAVGLLWAQTGFVVFAGIFLAEELYETGLLAAIIRGGER